MTIQLPPHRAERISQLIQSYLSKTFTTRKRWQQLLGELRSMTLAFHSSKHLFSSLQHALKGKHRKLRITNMARLALGDWLTMTTHLATCPVPITSFVPHAPHYLATSDASQDGMGGMWLPSLLASDKQPTVWRAPFIQEVRNNLVSSSNVMGTTTINEMELAAAVLGHATLLETIPHYRYINTYMGLDNTAAQAWLHHGSTSTTKAPAHILRLLAHYSRSYNATLNSFHVDGTTNTIADLLSRSFSFSDADLLQTLQRVAPVQPPWRLVTPRAALVSKLNSILLNKLHAEGSHDIDLQAKTPHGLPGPTSVSPYPRTPSFPKSTTPYHFYKSSLIDTEWAPLLPPALRSKAERWRRPFVPLARRWPHWASTTPAFNSPENSTFASTDSSSSTQNAIRRQHALSPFPSK